MGRRTTVVATDDVRSVPRIARDDRDYGVRVGRYADERGFAGSY